MIRGVQNQGYNHLVRHIEETLPFTNLSIPFSPLVMDPDEPFKKWQKCILHCLELHGRSIFFWFTTLNTSNLTSKTVCAKLILKSSQPQSSHILVLGQFYSNQMSDVHQIAHVLHVTKYRNYRKRLDQCWNRNLVKKDRAEGGPGPGKIYILHKSPPKNPDPN